MNKQAYALRKTGNGGLQEFTQDFASHTGRSLDEAKHDLGLAGGFTPGLLGAITKNIYDTARKHDGNYLESAGQYGAGITGGFLGGSALGSFMNESGSEYGEGALKGGILSAGMLGGQHLGQKGYDAIRKTMKGKEEKIEKQAYALRKSASEEYDETKEGPRSKALDYAGRGAMLGGIGGGLLSHAAGNTAGPGLAVGSALGAGIVGGGRGLYEVLNRDALKETYTDEMSPQEKIKFLKQRGIGRTIGAGAYGLGLGFVGADQLNAAGKYSKSPGRHLHPGTNTRTRSLDPAAIGLAAGLATAGLEANQSRKRIKKLRQEMDHSNQHA